LEESTDRRHRAALVPGRQPKRLERSQRDRARTGANDSEAQRFRVEARHRLLVERVAAAESAKLVDQVSVRSPVSGTRWEDVHRNNGGAAPLQI
jgi:hypothetical protein